MFNIINQKIFLPIGDIIQGLSMTENLSFLLKSQFWSKNELIDYQELRLKELIKHAYENVPYYIEWFKKNKLVPQDIRHTTDLCKLPVLTKTEIRKNPENFTAKDHGKNNPIRLNSSGSTGEPFNYFISRSAYSLRYAAALRGWSWMGYRPGDHYMKLSQNQRSSAVKKLQDFVNRCSYIHIPDLSRKSILTIIESLENKEPQFVRSYPDPLLFIAKILREKNKTLKSIQAINSTGNILTPDSRSIIEERFNCPVYDSYSCEGSALFYEGPNRDNFLGSTEYAITEILDDNFSEVNSGEIGMHVTTDLHNFAMPFIRYNTQDLVVKSGVESSCGRHLTGLDKILGRENDILVTPSGNLLIVHLFTIFFEYFDSIKQFQIEQLQLDEFVFRLVVGESFNHKIREEIQEYWQKLLGHEVKLNIEVHDSIPLLYSGKRRFLIRNKDIKLPY